MVASISCVILFGIITITTGNPVRNNREDTFQEEDEFQFQRLLQSLADAYNEASKYEQEASNDYLDSRARWTKPRQVNNQVKPQQYYKSYGNEDEDQINVNEVNRIYQFLQQNGDKSGNNVAKKLIDELLTLDGNKPSKPSAENDDVYEVSDLLSNLKKDSADSYEILGNVHGNNLKAKNIIPGYELFKGRNDNNYDDDTNNNDKSLRESKFASQKIKVNDELDAVILGLSDVDDLLSKLNVRNPKEPKNKLKVSNSAKLLQNVDLQNLFPSKNDFNKNNVEAAVFDLTQVENGDAVAKQIKRLLTQSSEASHDYEDYGNLVEKYLKQGIYDVQKKDVTSRGTPIIMAHNENNNNVYIPKWLLTEIVRSYGKETPAKEKSKVLIPLTKQQKAKRNKVLNLKPPRIFRRNGEQDVGVPFHLEVEGLGQVNP